MTDLTGGEPIVGTGRVSGVHEEVGHVLTALDGDQFETEQVTVDTLTCDHLRVTEEKLRLDMGGRDVISIIVCIST